MDVEKLRRYVTEFNKCGSGKELARQLDLNVSIEQRTIELTNGVEAQRRTGEMVRQHTEQLLEYDSKAQENHEKQLSKMTEEQARNQNIIDSQKTEIADLAAQKNQLRVENAAGKWFVALLHRDPAALRTLQPYLGAMLNHPEDLDPTMLEAVFYQLMKIAEKELTSIGRLVSRKELNAAKSDALNAKYEADRYKLQLDRLSDLVGKFIEGPERMSTQQKRILLRLVRDR